VTNGSLLPGARGPSTLEPEASDWGGRPAQTVQRYCRPAANGRGSEATDPSVVCYGGLGGVSFAGTLGA